MSVLINPYRFGIGGNDAFTVLLAHFDGADGSTTLTDSSLTTPHALTAGGNAQIDTAQSKFGGSSLLLDGTGDSVSFDGSNADFTFGTADFSIDWWMRTNDAALEGGAVRRILGMGGSATRPDIYINTNGTLEFGISTGAIETSTTSVADGAWHHCAITRAGTALRLFIDGVQEGGGATNSTNFDGANPSYIGRYQVSAIGHYNGWIDEFRISKGIARWTANFTPPALPYS